MLTARTLLTSRLGFAWLCCLLFLIASKPAADAAQPRIVNLYNFVRNSDYRLENSEDILFEATRREIELIKPTGLPATWALQYDALINPRYQKLFKEQLGAKDEIAAWWEIPRPLAEKAGLKWRGQHEWDSQANVGFSPGYTPEERRKLVDVYMADFKAIFGYYPKTVGSWFIDEVTLQYMVSKYGIVASCNCKDQIGTDGYTLWGGYWNQAYYPSRLNAYMPAQTKAGQIDVPVFRMLGSDPIYQGYSPGMWTLEPVYRDAGGSADWVAWFMNNLIHQPALAFGYTQAGQENSFGWEAMKSGLTLQVALFAEQAKAGEIQVQTLAQSGQWFHGHFAVTPPTAFACLNDWKHEGHKSVWYDSRFYRLNVVWEQASFYIRDIHCFDEHIVSSTHDTLLTTTSLTYGTLPIMDGALWSGTDKPGMWPVLIAADGKKLPMIPDGVPVIRELNKMDLSISQSLHDGGTLNIICRESVVDFAIVDQQGKPMRWAWDLVGGVQQKSVVQAVSSNSVSYHALETDYRLKVLPAAAVCQQLADGTIRLNADEAGKLEMIFGATP